MIRALFVVALAFAAVSAQRWPMITVNANGEIVLQSLTRAQSFQITAAATTTAPTSSGSASFSTAAQLQAGVSAYVVTTATSPATGHGVTLPAPTVGAKVDLYQSQTTFVTYTIYTSASSVFINSDSTTTSVAFNSRHVVCSVVSTTRWNCAQDQFTNNAYSGNLMKPIGAAIAAATTLSVIDSGSIFAVSAAVTITLPACTTANLGLQYTFVQNVAGAVIYASANGNTDNFLGFSVGAATGQTPLTVAKAGATGVSVTSLALTATTISGALVTAQCALLNYWFLNINTGGSAGAVAA